MTQLLCFANRPEPLIGFIEHGQLLEASDGRDRGWKFAGLTPSEAGPIEVAATEYDVAELASSLRLSPIGCPKGERSPFRLARWLVFTNPVSGQDAQFNDWYDHQHVDDTLAIPGFVAGQRFEIEGAPETSPWRYLAIYDIILENVSSSLAEAAARRGTQRMRNPGYLAPGAHTRLFAPYR